ncbi:hypothetical protein [Thalassospira xiamenensis]|uniref:hypothetical protein n=1 Tax=Thalassospira xiamenensis TaxID=220697 RepID=UPI000DED88E6|nr:hypothetical protein [Thalassospira xiamenensis]
MAGEKLPWFKFKPIDWQGDDALQTVSLAARGLWMEMLCIMHKASPRGYLVLNGNAMTDVQLSRAIGASIDDITALRGELEHAGVYSIDGKGFIYSRRMLRDDKAHRTAKKNGKKGGNPAIKRRNASNCNYTDNSAPVNQQVKGMEKGGDKAKSKDIRDKDSPPVSPKGDGFDVNQAFRDCQDILDRHGFDRLRFEVSAGSYEPMINILRNGVPVHALAAAAAEIAPDRAAKIQSPPSYIAKVFKENEAKYLAIQPPDPGMIAYGDALAAWQRDGKQGPAPKRSDFTTVKRAANDG